MNYDIHIEWAYCGVIMGIKVLYYSDAVNMNRCIFYKANKRKIKIL